MVFGLSCCSLDALHAACTYTDELDIPSDEFMRVYDTHLQIWIFIFSKIDFRITGTCVHFIMGGLLD